MRKLLALLLALLSIPASAGINHGVAAVSYVGPGDVVGSASFWVGLRAYSLAKATANAPAIKIVRSSDSHSCDVLLATTGGLGNTGNCSTGGENGTAVATWCNATTCKIDIFYDQIGAANFTANNSGTRATLTFNCINTTLPCADFGAGVSFYGGANASVSQPLTESFVAIRTGAFTSQNDILTLANGTFFDAANNRVGAFFGASTSTVASDNAWHAFQTVVNSTSSIQAVDATQTTGLSMGNNATGASIWLGTQSSGGNNPLNGKITEAGVWATNFSGAQMTNMCNNQFTYWGTSVSC
jgi:hypothetical protein